MVNRATKWSTDKKKRNEEIESKNLEELVKS
jgi:hypothetical protein